MSVTINGVTVRLQRDPENWRRFQVAVQVVSRKRPGLKAERTMDPGKAQGLSDLTKGIAAAAALNAEYLGDKYGDNIDPSLAIRDALQAFGEECRLLAAQSAGVGDKLKRLSESAWIKGQDREREAVRRMRWLIDRGERLTGGEIEWINAALAQHHASQI